MEIDFTTIVLAGGRSLRMGTDKALLPIDGLSLLERTVVQARQAGSSRIIIVTSWPDRYRFLPKLEGCAWVQEASPQSPLRGFYEGISVVETSWLLLLACDLPFLSSRSIATWAKDLATLPPETMAFLPKTESWEPLCGFYKATCKFSLAAYLQTTDRSFQRWLQSIEVAAIPTINSLEFFNCNTPSDHQIATSLSISHKENNN